MLKIIKNIFIFLLIIIILFMNKTEKYQLIYEQIRALLNKESDEIANMANVAAIIHETFKFWWTGFYRVIDNELVLGPFQGPVACTRIAYGKGVCGTSWKEAQTIIVKDVHEFPGHIACSSASQSEIVVPIFKENQVVAVLDIDSEKLSTFDETDKKWIEKIVGLFLRNSEFQNLKTSE